MVEPNSGTPVEPKIDPQVPASGTGPLSQNPPVVPPVVPPVEPPVEPVVPPVEPVVPPVEPVTPPVEPVTPPVEPPKVNVQDRINRMYARLQKEKDARAKVETENKALKAASGDDPTDPEEPKPLTEADVRNIMATEVREKKFKGVEAEVFVRHPEALNEDGSFNMNDPFMKRYLEIGMRNPMLAAMEDGPNLAEAQAEKELGVGYTQGKKDEATRAANAHNAHTLPAGNRPPAVNLGTITPEEHKVAMRMGLTDKEYLENKIKKVVK